MADLTEFWNREPAIAAEMDQLEASVRDLLHTEGRDFQDRLWEVIDELTGHDEPTHQAIGGLASIGQFHLLAAANLFGDDA